LGSIYTPQKMVGEQEKSGRSEEHVGGVIGDDGLGDGTPEQWRGVRMAQDAFCVGQQNEGTAGQNQEPELALVWVHLGCVQNIPCGHVGSILYP